MYFWWKKRRWKISRYWLFEATYQTSQTSKVSLVLSSLACVSTHWYCALFCLFPNISLKLISWELSATLNNYTCIEPSAFNICVIHVQYKFTGDQPCCISSLHQLIPSPSPTELLAVCIIRQTAINSCSIKISPFHSKYDQLLNQCIVLFIYIIHWLLGYK